MDHGSAQSVLSELKLDPFSTEQLHLQLQRQMRQKIQAHRLAPGEKLPTNHEMAAVLKVSYKTVQRAMTALANQGVIVRRQRKGTFVNQTLVPRTVGIFCTQAVFDPRSSPSTWLLAHHLSNILHAQQRDGQIYYVPAGARPERNKTYRDLVRDLEEHRVAGLIFISYSPEDRSHHHLLETAQRRGIPAVATILEEICPHTVYVDHLDLCRRGVRYLVEQGSRRIALVGTPITPHFLPIQEVLEAAREQGVPMEPDDIVWTPLKSAAPSTAYIALGEQWGRDFDLNRYDGVLIADDIVAVGFATALARRNVRVPRQLRVATMWNRGNPLSLALPFARFEVNVEQWARRSVGMLDDLIEHGGSRNRRPHVYLKLEGPVEPAALQAPHFMEATPC